MKEESTIRWAVVPIIRYSVVRYEHSKSGFSVGECGQYSSEERALTKIGELMKDDTQRGDCADYPICFLNSEEDFRAVAKAIKNLPINLIIA